MREGKGEEAVALHQAKIQFIMLLQMMLDIPMWPIVVRFKRHLRLPRCSICSRGKEKLGKFLVKLGI
jgi:hypothetical protein